MKRTWKQMVNDWLKVNKPKRVKTPEDAIDGQTGKKMTIGNADREYMYHAFSGMTKI